MTRPNRAAAAVGAVAAAAVIAAITPTAAFAAGPTPPHRSTTTFDCAGLGTVTIVNPPASAGDNFSAAQILNGGHLVPVAFTYDVKDTTAGMPLGDDTVVTHPAAHPRQETTTCTNTWTARLGDLLPPDQPLPVGAAASDTVEFTFTVTAIPQP